MCLFFFCQQQPLEEELPPGWEIRSAPGGRNFYINHRTRKTQWEPPIQRTNSTPDRPGVAAAAGRQEDEEEDLGMLPVSLSSIGHVVLCVCVCE